MSNPSVYTTCLIILLVTSMCFAQNRTIEIRSVTPGRPIRIVPSSDTIYHVLEIVNGAGVYFAADDITIRNVVVRLELSSLTNQPYLQVDGPSLRNNITLEVIVPSGASIPYVLDNSIQGQSVVSFTIDTLTIKVSNLENWKWFMKSPTSVNLNIVPDNTNVVMHFLQPSPIKIKQIGSFMMVINGQIDISPDVWQKNASFHAVGPQTVLNVDLKAFSEAHFDRGCLNTTFGNVPTMIPDYYRSQMQYYGVNVEDTLRGCNAYTYRIGQINLDAPIVFATSISSEQTRILNVPDGNLVYTGIAEILNGNYSTNSLEINFDVTFALSTGYSSNFRSPFAPNATLIIDLSHDGAFAWKINCRDAHVVEASCPQGILQICPVANNNMPKIHSVHSKSTDLHLVLDPTLLAIQNPLVTLDGKVITIQDDTQIIFSISFLGETGLYLDFPKLSKWSTLILNGVDEQYLEIEGDPTSQQGLLVLQNEISDNLAVQFSQSLNTFGKVQIGKCNVKQILLNCAKSCVVAGDSVPNSAELVIDGVETTQASIAFENHSAFRGGQVNIKNDIDETKFSTILVGTQTKSSVKTSKLVTNFESGCIATSQQTSAPSTWFVSKLDSFGIVITPEILKCGLYISKIGQLTITAGDVTVKDIEMSKHVQDLVVSGTYKLINIKTCFSGTILGRTLHHQDVIKITSFNGTVSHIQTSFCAKDSLQISSILGIPFQYKFNAGTTKDSNIVAKWNHESVTNLELSIVESDGKLPNVNLLTSGFILTVLMNEKWSSEILSVNRISLTMKDSEIKWTNTPELLSLDFNGGSSNVTLNPDVLAFARPPIITHNADTIDLVNLNIPVNSTVVFANSFLQWDRQRFSFKPTEGSDSCVDPRIDCSPIGMIDVSMTGNKCTGTSRRENCVRNQIALVRARGKEVSCNLMETHSKFVMGKTINAPIMTDVSIPFVDFLFATWWIFNGLFSLIFYPFLYIFDFGYPTLLVGGILENHVGIASSWSSRARMMVNFGRITSYGSKCAESVWNYIPWTSIVLVSIALVAIVGILSKKVEKVNSILGRSLFVDMFVLSLLFFWVPYYFILYSNGWGIALNVVLSIFLFVIMLLSIVFFRKIGLFSTWNRKRTVILILILLNLFTIAVSVLIDSLQPSQPYGYAILIIQMFLLVKACQDVFMFWMTFQAQLGKIGNIIFSILMSLCVVLDLTWYILEMVYVHQFLQNDGSIFVLAWICNFFAGSIKSILLFLILFVLSPHTRPHTPVMDEEHAPILSKSNIEPIETSTVSSYQLEGKEQELNQENID